MTVQALWALASVSKSTVLARQEAASAIISSAKRHAEKEGGSAAAQRLIARFADAADQFIRLCNYQGDKRCARTHATHLLFFLAESYSFGLFRLGSICLAL